MEALKLRKELQVQITHLAESNSHAVPIIRGERHTMMITSQAAFITQVVCS